MATVKVELTEAEARALFNFGCAGELDREAVGTHHATMAAGERALGKLARALPEFKDQG